MTDLLGDAITLSLVGDWGVEAGAVNDTGGGSKLDLGDNRLPFPDLFDQNRNISTRKDKNCKLKLKLYTEILH